MSEPDLTIGLVAHHAFCPRRAWLELHGETTDTAQVAVGVVDHQSVDDPTTSRSHRLRAVEVSSTVHGYTGQCDSVEVSEEGDLTLVEHKANPVRKRSDVTEPQRIQLALQAIALEEAGHRVTGGAVWFSSTRDRVDVPITSELRQQAINELRRTRATLSRRRPPAPLEDDPRCTRCSHVTVCLPDEHRERRQARRIGVGDPLGRVLHLATPGTRASLRQGRIEMRQGDEVASRVPLGQVAGLVIHGNADVSSALVREILHRGFPIVWCAWSGRVVGWATPADGPNGDMRNLQHRLTDAQKLAVAREIVRAKIANQRYILRRYGLGAREELARLMRRAQSARTRDELFGIEGNASKAYFKQLGGALRPEWATLRTRRARPARDPINAALNLVYSLLLTDVIRAIVACGLDPAGGVLHSATRNKPALALDLMEEFRPLVAESALLWAINNRELKAHHFTTTLDTVRLTDRGRKTLIAAYERRATNEFRHPQFGYRVTWRRAMEVQARLFLATVAGERDTYKGITAR